MTLVALTHGYVPTHAMGGEVSLHRTLRAAGMPATVLTRTDQPYTIDGIDVRPISISDVLNPSADPTPLVAQLDALGATVVAAQNELALPAVRAAIRLHLPSVVFVHAPPRYGRGIAQAVGKASYRVYNTGAAAKEWHQPGMVLHPPVCPLPASGRPNGEAVTLLSNLVNKGVDVALHLASTMPGQRFIIVRSPAEPTHGLEGFDDRAAALPNVEVGERVAPHQVAERYLARTRILIVPSRFETYGMSALEAAGYGIPSVSIMNKHVAEGIGDAAYGTGPLDVDGTELGIYRVNANYDRWSQRARERAEQVAERQERELAEWSRFVTSLSP